MSDKFFFKGRQDTRQNHTKHSFQSKANQKAGTKKYPLRLVVTSDARKEEINELLSENTLYAEITVDKQKGAMESIGELTTLLDKSGYVVSDKTPGRNTPCSCGSGKKYKKCCG